MKYHILVHIHTYKIDDKRRYFDKIFTSLWMQCAIILKNVKFTLTHGIKKFEISARMLLFVVTTAMHKNSHLEMSHFYSVIDCSVNADSIHMMTLCRKNYAHCWLQIYLTDLTECYDQKYSRWFGSLLWQAVPELQAIFVAIRKQFQILQFNVQRQEEEAEEELVGRCTKCIWNIQVIKCEDCNLYFWITFLFLSMDMPKMLQLPKKKASSLTIQTLTMQRRQSRSTRKGQICFLGIHIIAKWSGAVKGCLISHLALSLDNCCRIIVDVVEVCQLDCTGCWTTQREFTKDKRNCSDTKRMWKTGKFVRSLIRTMKLAAHFVDLLNSILKKNRQGNKDSLCILKILKVLLRVSSSGVYYCRLVFH